MYRVPLNFNTECGLFHIKSPYFFLFITSFRMKLFISYKVKLNMLFPPFHSILVRSILPPSRRMTVPISVSDAFSISI